MGGFIDRSHWMGGFRKITLDRAYRVDTDTSHWVDLDKSRQMSLDRSYYM